MMEMLDPVPIPISDLAGKKSYLKKTAIPSINLPRNEEQKRRLALSQQRQERRLKRYQETTINCKQVNIYLASFHLLITATSRNDFV